MAQVQVHSPRDRSGEHQELIRWLSRTGADVMASRGAVAVALGSRSNKQQPRWLCSYFASGFLSNTRVLIVSSCSIRASMGLPWKDMVIEPDETINTRVLIVSSCSIRASMG